MIETRKLVFPIIVRYKSNVHARKKISYGRNFETPTTRFLEKMTAFEYVYHLIYLSGHVQSVEINGDLFWSKDNGFVFNIEGLEDIGFDENKREFYSKQQKFVNFLIL